MRRSLGIPPVFILVLAWMAPQGAHGHSPEEADRTIVLDRWAVEPEDPPGLLDPQVMCICEDGEGRVWFGTAGGGVVRHDPDTGKWRAFVDRDLFGLGVVGSCQTLHHGDVRFEVWGRNDAHFDVTRGVMKSIPDAWFDPRDGHRAPFVSDELLTVVDVQMRPGVDRGVAGSHPWRGRLPVAARAHQVFVAE